MIMQYAKHDVLLTPDYKAWGKGNLEQLVQSIQGEDVQMRAFLMVHGT
jgi:hypothetical protein